jgi:hypothetical protein
MLLIEAAILIMVCWALFDSSLSLVCYDLVRWFVVTQSHSVFRLTQASWVVTVMVFVVVFPCLFLCFTVLHHDGYYCVVLYILFCGLHGGHWYMWLSPLLAPVSTVGKSRLVVVAVQGAPSTILFLTRPFLNRYRMTTLHRGVVKVTIPRHDWMGQRQ